MRNDLVSVGKTSRSKSKRKFMKSQSLLKKNEHIKQITSKSAIKASGIVRRRARLSSPKRATSEVHCKPNPQSPKGAQQHGDQSC